MQTLLRIFDAIVKCAAMLGAFLLAMSVAVTVGDVILRPFGLRYFSWHVDAVELGLVIATFLLAPWILTVGAHVRVDVVLQILPARLAKGVERLAWGWGAVLCGWLGWLAIGELLSAAQRGTLFIRSFVIPEWWILTVVPYCFAALCVELVLRAAGLRSREERAAI